MEVKPENRTPTVDRHSIEWGNSTWTKDEPEINKVKSIRNRYDKDDGGFNYAGSAEIPWDDFNEMIIQSIERNHFTKEELGKIITAIILK